MSAASSPVASSRIRAVAPLLAVVAGLALAGCTDPNAFAPACPGLRLLPDGADLTRFNGTGRDLTDLVFQARLDGVPPSTGSCKWADKTHTRVAVTMQVAMTATRGPAMAGRSSALPYFVAVGEGPGGHQILDRQEYATKITFPGNVDRTSVVSDPVTLLLPVSREKSAAAYTVWVSLQLTPDELTYNRTHARPGS